MSIILCLEKILLNFALHLIRSDHSYLMYNKNCVFCYHQVIINDFQIVKGSIKFSNFIRIKCICMKTAHFFYKKKILPRYLFDKFEKHESKLDDSCSLSIFLCFSLECLIERIWTKNMSFWASFRML